MSRIPKLRFKEFSFPLDLEKFGRVVKSNIYGPRFNANDYDVNGNVKTIRGTDVSRNGEINYTQVPIAKIEENTINTHRLEDGDLVMITTADCGLTGVFRKQDFDYICSAYAVKISLNEKGNPYYFKYFFQTKSAKNEISSYIRKATVANLPGSDILKIKVYLPSLSEQQKIASFLTAVDTKIDQLTRKKELFEQYKKGAMRELFSQELRFKDDNENEFPEWEEKKLGDVCLIKKGSQLNRDGLDAIGQYAVINGGITPSGYNDEWNTEANTITISEGGNSCGYVSFMTEKFWSGGHCYTLENIKSTVKNEYLFQYLKAYEIQIMRLRVGSGLPNIQKGEISKFIVKIPYIDEQNKIASFLSVADTKIDFVAKQLEEVKNFKKGLLQQMFV